ncbi:hypothetical protein WA026_008568 [Henosepilachna vigintioctopunctata]|uniref:Ubiquitin-like-conjugating enzyme ATG10 n=1 Tax=Henosepilachna vigintioctopunctata TaxID=420089 RepID=A0AAW1UGW4_9CUCU
MSSEEPESFTEDFFKICLNQILELSNKYQDGWKLHKKEEFGSVFITKKSRMTLSAPEEDLQDIHVTFEYHVTYHPSYCVPVLAFHIWKQDGTFLALEDFWKYCSHLKNSNMYDTLTQLDHPVLQRPILTLHPCKTHEIMRSFMKHSKNPVISWLSTVGYAVNLKLLKEYQNVC